MILRLLKNHPITARVLRRETATELTSAHVVSEVVSKTNSKRASQSAIKTALVALIALSTSQALLAQDGGYAEEELPVPSANAQTQKLSDFAPEVVSKIKADHYASQEKNIRAAYHQQLQENRQRQAFSARQASYQQVAFDRAANGKFVQAGYQAPVGHQPPVAQASHSEAFPRTAANAPDEPIAPTSAPAPNAAYSAPTQNASYSAPAQNALYSAPTQDASYSAPTQDASYSAPAQSASNPAPAQNASYSAPQTFVPPVHIEPTQQDYTDGVPGSSPDGRRNAVQNSARQATNNYDSASSDSQTNVARPPVLRPPVYQPPVYQPQRNETAVQPQRTQQRSAQRAPQRSTQPSPTQQQQQAPQENTHVFLQDRIANALSRHFKRGKKVKKVQQAPEQLATTESAVVPFASNGPVTRRAPIAPSTSISSMAPIAESVMESDLMTPPVYQPVSTTQYPEQTDIVYSEHYSAPLETSLNDDAIIISEKFVNEESYAEILQGNRLASRTSGGIDVPDSRPADHQTVTKSESRRRSIERVAHHDSISNDDPFEDSFDENDSTIFDRYENLRSDSTQRDDGLRAQPLRRSKKSTKRIAAYSRPDKSRPDKYSRTRKRVPAENVSILQQEEDEAGPDIDGQDDFSPIDEFDIEQENDEDVGSSDRPNQRDDLRDVDEEIEREETEGSGNRNLRDRVRSRLEDELDLDDLDDELEEELDDEIDDDDLDDGRPSRAPQKSCREFQSELIAGSIRDISLDISPPAASEGAQYGGLSRTWTDRRGDTLATGALVDIRRGYVILDSGQKLAYARLSEADLAAVSEFWRLPEVCVIGNSGGSPYRDWAPQVVTWKASNLCHKPLYFEDIQLERYGHSRGPIAQPIHSTLHFFTSLISLPYQTGISPPNECQYALGFYRPGNCAPWLKCPIPISLQSVRRQTLFVTGAAFIP